MNLLWDSRMYLNIRHRLDVIDPFINYHAAGHPAVRVRLRSGWNYVRLILRNVDNAWEHVSNSPKINILQISKRFNDKTPLNDKRISLMVESTTLNNTIFALRLNPSTFTKIHLKNN